MFRDLQETKLMKLCFRLGKLKINGYSDVDFVDDHNGRKSTSGHGYLFGGEGVLWSSKNNHV